jgi:GR25 family glycosyltransferase involved in LPS biosynthesis
MSDSSLPTWKSQAQSLWAAGDRQGAINTILAVINPIISQSQPDQDPFLQLAYYCFQLNDFSAGEQVLSQLLGYYPTDLEILENRAVMRTRQGKDAAALEDFQAVVAANPHSVNAWDGLTATLYRLQQWPAAIQAGSQALTLKAQQCSPSPSTIPWPDRSPQDWDAAHPGQDVISFSLWGHHPRYLRGAVQNLLVSPNIYPGWQCRFYVDETVPAEFGTFVREHGGQIVLQPAQQSLRQKLCWRFQVANDPTVRRFLVRDTDSVVNPREARAVAQWLASDRWFHVMRDYWTHTDLILAGMWGGRAGLLPPIAPLVIDYRSGRLETANIDQWLLRDLIWPLIGARTLIHDRCFPVLGAQPWPDPDPPGNLHVGQDEFAVRSQEQTQRLGDLIDRYPWLQTPSAPTSTLESISPLPWQGYWINLDRAVERRQVMLQQLQSVQLSHYQRLAAVDGTVEYGHLPRPGVMGCWQSHLQALRLGAATKKVVHILEDDTYLGPHSLPLLNSLITSAGFDTYDIVYTDVLLDYLTSQRYFQAFYTAAQKTPPGQMPAQVHLINLQDLRFTCANSYLIAPQHLPKVLRLLEQAYQTLNPQKPEPIDMVIQHLVHTQKLTAAVTCPFITTIDLELQALTDINLRTQTGLQKSLWLHNIHRQAFFYGADDRLLLERLRQQFPDQHSTPKSQLLALLYEQLLVEKQQNF